MRAISDLNKKPPVDTIRFLSGFFAIGIAAGIPAALALTRVVQSQLFGLTAHDPSTLVAATGLLVLVACAAGYIPALRASRLDPMDALRYE